MTSAAMIQDPSRWPLDFERLARGSFIPPEKVESATMKERTSPTYWCAVLRLRSQIQDWFREHRGDIVTVVSQGDGLKILTHEEQAVYSRRREMHGMRQILTAQVEGRSVDLDQLADDHRAKHEAWLSRNAFRIQQMRKRPPPRLTE